MGLTVTHRFTSTLPDSTNPLLVNASNWNDLHIITGFPFIVVSDYDFAAITPGGSLIVGANVVTLPRVPKGVNGSDQGHLIYISNGTGTPEACLITGGSAISEGTNQTIIFTCTSAHAGAWTITSATAGWQEAAQDAGPNRTVYFTQGTYNLLGTFRAPFNGQTYFCTNPLECTITSPNGTNLQKFVNINGRVDTRFVGLGWFGNFVNQTYLPSTINTAIDATDSIRTVVQGCRFRGFGDVNATGFTQVLSFYSAFDFQVNQNLFISNMAYEVNMNTCNGGILLDNTFGVADISQSQTPTNWWDTYAGGFGTLCIGSNKIYFDSNRMFGCARALVGDTPTAYGYLISSGGGFLQMEDVKIQNNAFYGLGNSRGTLNVSSGSGTVNGLNTYFWSGDVNRAIKVEGSGQLYTINGYSSALGITVTPALDVTGTNLRYQYQNSGDAISVAPVNKLMITGNYIEYSGDNGIDIGADLGNFCQHVLIANNQVLYSQVDGLYIGGSVFDVLVNCNTFTDNCRKGLSGHQGAIEWSPSNQGTVSPAQPQWHITISNNQYIDDQATATQLYRYNIESGAHAHVFSNTIQGDVGFRAVGTEVLFDPGTTQTLQGECFNHPYSTGIGQLTPVAFADLASINGSQLRDGMQVYCFDAKSISDGVAAGSVAVSGGTGVVVHRQNSTWRISS